MGDVIVLLVTVMNGGGEFPMPSVYGPFVDLLQCQQAAIELQASDDDAEGVVKRYACIRSQPIGDTDSPATEE
jgi:hypothetical protein